MILLLSYVAGATPFGYLAGRAKGVDIRILGSGNIGATNVIRVLGKGIGIPVFVLDMLKGLLPVIAVQAWCESRELDAGIPGILAALGTVLGHNFTFWLNFRGGKGIATSAGALLALITAALAVAVVVWLILFFATRYVALASIGAAATIAVMPAIQHLVTGNPGIGMVIFAAVLGVLAIWRHRSNIRRLLDGTENRFVPRNRRPAA